MYTKYTPTLCFLCVCVGCSWPFALHSTRTLNSHSYIQIHTFTRISVICCSRQQLCFGSFNNNNTLPTLDNPLTHSLTHIYGQFPHEHKLHTIFDIRFFFIGRFFSSSFVFILYLKLKPLLDLFIFEIKIYKKKGSTTSIEIENSNLQRVSV